METTDWHLRILQKGLPIRVINSHHNMADQDIEITAYLKTFCGWSEGVRAIFRKYDLAFEEKDIIKNPAFRWEMEQKSGQPLSPCVVVNGTMLSVVKKSSSG